MTKPSPLIGLRFVAAFMLFVFHVREGHRLGLMTFAPFDDAPLWLSRLIERSYVATGLFFVLSGHVLAQRFLRDDGGTPRLDRPPRDFVLRRVTRVWPLHAAAWALIAPAVFFFAATTDELGWGDAIASGVASLALVQAWVPPWVMSWNVPTWALSVVVSFYAAFALVATRRPRWLRQRTRGEAGVALAALLALAVLPALVVTLGRADAPSSLSTGLDVLLVKFLPLVWWPVFACGAVLARSPWGRADAAAPTVRPGLGDAAWLALVVLLATVDDVPYLVLRHGLAVPLMLVGLVDLDRGRGVVAWALARPIGDALGRASFAVFIVQLPVAGGVGAALAARRAEGEPGSALDLTLVLGATVVVAWFVSRVDARIVGALRRRLGVAERASLVSPASPGDDARDDRRR